MGSIRTDGWDFGIVYASPSRWRVHWQTTHLGDYTELLRNATGAVVERRSLVGETQADRGKPAWKSTLTIDWRHARWAASWTIRYIHAMTERCPDFLDGTPDGLTNLGLCAVPDFDNNGASRNSLGTTVYHDTQANYRQPAGKGGFTLSVGASNLFDRDPPPSQSAAIGGYDASVYDIPGGRLGYIRVAYATDS